MKQAFEVTEFSTETWSDFETLFGKHKGVGGRLLVYIPSLHVDAI